MARDCPTQRGRSCSGERPQLNVGVLGATGTVGQRFVLLLDGHPDLRLHALGASAKSAGKVYSDAVRWKLPSPPPAHAAAMVVKGCDPESFVDCDLVFSALDSDVAGEIEMAFIKANVPVFSNAMNYRNNAAVPLVVPLANPSHLDLIPHQRSVHGVERGFLVTNSNCSTAGLAVVLQALKEAFGAAPDRVMVTTLQAISGAGYPGVASLDILDNVVPYISGEEGKVETEPLKILGSLDPSGAALAPLAGMKISATCNRVPVVDGHTECVSLSFPRTEAMPVAPSPAQVADALRAFVPEAVTLGCPSAPAAAVVVQEDPDRPQPRLDRNAGGGNSVTVGRIRPCNILDVKFTLLVHNTILGAAGSGILNAELALAKGYLSPRPRSN